MPEAAAAPLAESLLVDAVAPVALETGLGAAEMTGLAGGLGGAGTVGGLFGGAGAGAGATGLGGISSLAALPATTAEVAPVAMGQITSALAPTAAGTASLGSLAGTAPASLATAMPTISSESMLSAADLFTPEELQAAEGTLSSEMAAKETAQDAIRKQLIGTENIAGSPVSQMGTGQFSDPVLNKAMTPSSDILADRWFPTYAGETIPAGTSDLVSGGVNPATGAPITPGGSGGIGNLLSSAGQWMKENPLKTAAGAIGAAALLAPKPGLPEREKYSGPLSKFHYDPSKYTPYTPQPPANPYRAQYTSYAKGGIADLGGYSDGGQMLKGPGDGMSDSIPASIANKQPARLANEEFVVPADVVSHLGNGSSDAGAKQLYRMMDRVRKARTGTAKQGRQINPSKYMPV